MTAGKLIKADKRTYAQRQYRRLGPVPYWQNYLDWCVANGKMRAYHFRVGWLERQGFDLGLFRLIERA
jgi:hypothetical protein